jgi:hypothetical protein
MASPLYRKFQHVPYRYVLIDNDHDAHHKCNSNAEACESAKSLSISLATTIHIFNVDNDEIFGSYTKGV